MERSKVSADGFEHLLITWDNCHALCRTLARTLYDIAPWEAIIAITRGGMVPAAIVARELGIRCIGTYSIDFYGIDKMQKTPQVILEPHPSLMKSGGNNILVIDEVCDSGRTIREVVRPALPRAHIAVMHATHEGKELVDTFVALKPPNSWIDYPWDTAPTYINPIVGKTD